MWRYVKYVKNMGFEDTSIRCILISIICNESWPGGAGENDDTFIDLFPVMTHIP